MKVVIPGGSGQVGTILARAFHQDGDEVVNCSRNPLKAPWRVVARDGRSLGPRIEEVNGADAVINLAGRRVNCRYNAKNRRLNRGSTRRAWLAWRSPAPASRRGYGCRRVRR